MISSTQLNDFSLVGLQVIITRPLEQAQALASLVKNAGGKPIVFPTIAIKDPAELGPLHNAVDKLHEFNWAIFISPAAVNRAMSFISSRREWPQHVKTAVIGPGSENELKKWGMTAAAAPQSQFDSEGLLEQLSPSSVSGKKVIIFRGNGGREILHDTLIARGAAVEYVSCYQRVKPTLDITALLGSLNADNLAVVTATSSEGLANLAEQTNQGQRQILIKMPLFATHARIADAGRSLGFKDVTLAEPTDTGLMKTLHRWYASKRTS